MKNRWEEVVGRGLALVGALLLVQCGQTNNECPDSDGDGYRSMNCGGSDCNDEAYDINPDADEICSDGIDNNCDGSTDESTCTTGSCGGLNQACCVTGNPCNLGLVCQSEICKSSQTCGGSNQPCCVPGSTCNTGFSCQSNLCKPNSSCGSDNGPCCASGQACTNASSVCYSNLCQTPAALCTALNNINSCIPTTKSLAVCVGTGSPKLQTCTTACTASGNGWHSYCDDQCGKKDQPCCKAGDSTHYCDPSQTVCASNQICNGCTPDCAGRECGPANNICGGENACSICTGTASCCNGTCCSPPKTCKYDGSSLRCST